jgi:hypothetical protein
LSAAGHVHVNTAEGYFSLFKRGLVGIYQHISVAHLPRYLAEFDQGWGRQEAALPTGRLTKDTAFLEGRAKLRLILELLGY